MPIIAASFYGGIPLNPALANAPIHPTSMSYDTVQPDEPNGCLAFAIQSGQREFATRNIAKDNTRGCWWPGANDGASELCRDTG